MVPRCKSCYWRCWLSHLQAYCRHRNYRRNLRAVLPIGRGITGATQWNSNRHDIGFVDLPAQAEGFPATLVRVRKSLQALQRDSENQVFPTLKEFLGKFPSGMRTLASRRWSSRAHMLLSFVPIPGAKLTINGALVESVFAIPAVPPSQSIVVGMMAMRNQLCFSLTVDPVVVDLASLQQEIDQTLLQISKTSA